MRTDGGGTLFAAAGAAADREGGFKQGVFLVCDV
jgi:hypothetical protein